MKRKETPPRSSETLPPGEIFHQRAETELPVFALVARKHAVDQFSELRRSNRDDVAALVRKAFARNVAIPDRSKHGAEKQHKSVRILMRGSNGLRHQVFR